MNKLSKSEIQQRLKQGGHISGDHVFTATAWEKRLAYQRRYRKQNYERQLEYGRKHYKKKISQPGWKEKRYKQDKKYREKYKHEIAKKKSLYNKTEKARRLKKREYKRHRKEYLRRGHEYYKKHRKEIIKKTAEWAKRNPSKVKASCLRNCDTNFFWRHGIKPTQKERKIKKWLMEQKRKQRKLMRLWKEGGISFTKLLQRLQHLESSLQSRLSTKTQLL